MAVSPNEAIEKSVKITGARFQSQSVTLPYQVLLEDVQLGGEEIQILLPATPGDPPTISSGELTFSGVISEASLNRLLETHAPRDLHNPVLTVLSGKVKFTGKWARFIPFTLEAAPRVENGVRIFLEVTAGKVAIPLPAMLIEILENKLNATLALDLSRLPIPVMLSEVRCEPGRITVVGRGRLDWPLDAHRIPGPFTAQSPTSADLAPETEPKLVAVEVPVEDTAITAADEPTPYDTTPMRHDGEPTSPEGAEPVESPDPVEPDFADATPGVQDAAPEGESGTPGHEFLEHPIAINEDAAPEGESGAPDSQGPEDGTDAASTPDRDITLSFMPMHNNPNPQPPEGH